MVESATERVLQKEISTRGDSPPLYEIEVAILPPEFTGSITGGTNESFIHARIAAVVNNSQLFTPVSRHLVQNAINASGVSNAKALLGLAAARDRFMAVLAENGFIPEFIIYPEITTMEETRKGLIVWRETSLNLQLAASSNGKVAHEQFDSLVQSTKSSSSEN